MYYNSNSAGGAQNCTPDAWQAMAAWAVYRGMALFLSCVQAIDHNRHAVLMTLLDAYPLVQVGWGLCLLG